MDLDLFYVSGDHLDLHVLTHSFPTRRSSDLATQGQADRRRRGFPRCHSRGRGRALIPAPRATGASKSWRYAVTSTASGRTGDAVAPTSFSGAMTKRNSAGPAAARCSRSRVSMIGTPWSTRRKIGRAHV